MCFYIKFISYILAPNLSHIVAYNASLIRGHHNGWRGSRLNLTRSFHSDSYFKRVVCIAFFCHYLSVNFRTTVGLLLVSRLELFHSLPQISNNELLTLLLGCKKDVGCQGTPHMTCKAYSVQAMLFSMHSKHRYIL